MVVQMDARARLIDPTPAPLEACPPESPLAMPEQPASAAPAGPRVEPHGRMGLILAGSGAVVLFAASQLIGLLSPGGMSLLEWVAVALFLVNMFWVAAAAGTAAAGAVQLLRDQPARKRALKPFFSRSRTALVFPMYNEDPARVMGGADAVLRSLQAEGVAENFEVFFLSDTRDAGIAEAEEAAFRRLIASRPHEPFFYRRRAQNTGRKAGNVAEFIQRWGGRYDYMVVLDADSLMSGRALSELVRRMDDSPRTGLIQTLPTIVNARTLFARIQQFAMRTYGPIFGAGLAWWSGGAGNFWGHNAIIRVRAFAAHAGLPRLPGKAPFGGPILSHDFVEAALLRRAGWAVEIAPDIEGSYEEAPPTLVEAAARDRRWAQGNLQHIALLKAEGFHWLSRAHITAGVMGYLSAVFWFALVLVSLALAAEGRPAEVAGEAILLSLLTATIVLSPKWLAVILWAADRLPGWERRSVFLPALAFETLVSSLTAPVQMVSQTLAVLSTVLGKDFGWAPQVRDRSGLDLADSLRNFAPHVAAGVGLLSFSLLQTDAVATWLAPLTAALLLSPAIGLLLSERVRFAGPLFFLTSVPEDFRRPAVVVAAARSTRWLRGGRGEAPRAPAARSRPTEPIWELARETLPASAPEPVRP
jgi:membrane glycosyltransferase